MNTSKRNALLKTLFEKRAEADFRKRGISPYDITRPDYSAASARYTRAINRILAIAPSAGKVDYTPVHNPDKSYTVKPQNAPQFNHEQNALLIKGYKSLGRHLRLYARKAA